MDGLSSLRLFGAASVPSVVNNSRGAPVASVRVVQLFVIGRRLQPSGQ